MVDYIYVWVWGGKQTGGRLGTTHHIKKHTHSPTHQINYNHNIITINTNIYTHARTTTTTTTTNPPPKKNAHTQRAAGPYEVAQEHIEILVQFGYVSMFAVAFPLAPILAFFNNVRAFGGRFVLMFVCGHVRVYKYAYKELSNFPRPTTHTRIPNTTINLPPKKQNKQNSCGRPA